MSGQEMSRRDFMKVTTGVVGGAIAALLGIPVIGYLLAPALREDKKGAPVAIGNLADIPVGTPHPFFFTLTQVNGWERTASSYGGYILRKSEDPADILVLSSRCTHLSCRVHWDDAHTAYLCPCHDAKFGRDGEVLDGPPPLPLGRFAHVVAVDGTLYITPVEILDEG